MTLDIRLPAEWEEQDGIMLAWPHEDTDWAYMLDEAEAVFIEIANTISKTETVVITSPCIKEVNESLERSGISLEKILFHELPTNDTWTRDFGPITVTVNNTPVLLDFAFNGWGLKYASDKDNLATRRLKQMGAFLPRVNTVGLVLEGGSIESDGKGTILTTSQCLLSPNRNPQLDRQEIESALSSLLGAKKVLWLENGHLAGDDTDAHIDTLARFCPDNTITYQSCDDPGDTHFEPLMKMAEELATFTTSDGAHFRLLPLPWPKARFDADGNRLPATYANFLVTNSTVLVPVYSDPSDDAALSVIAEAFPGREISGINCLPLIMQHGSLHCVTMQLPRGVLH